MRCPQCQFENEEGSKFCGNCGAALSINQPIPAATSTVHSGQVFCASCGTANPGDSLFCESCGSTLVLQESSYVITSAPQYATTVKKTSAAWWLMPIFLGWIGGIVAWLVVKENDKSKARKLLWTGIILTVLLAVFWSIMTIVVTPYFFANL